MALFAEGKGVRAPGAAMDKEILKGVLSVLFGVAAMLGLSVLVAGSGPDKAGCIARAPKDGVAVGNIERVCKLVNYS
jgi:hypothetical protein